MMEFGMRCLAIALRGLNKSILFILCSKRNISREGCQLFDDLATFGSFFRFYIVFVTAVIKKQLDPK